MRKIKKSLLDRMINGDLLPLLNHIKSDPELRLEVRQNGEAFVYYRKGKALEIGSLKADKNYGDIPDTNLAVTSPSEYFSLMKNVMDAWLNSKKERAEFDTQQNVARFNQNANGRYLVLDMEYAFEQHEISKENREKRGVFDLIGLDFQTHRIVFFEVKKGMGATKGKSGIEEHIFDFNTYLFGKNSNLFRRNLKQDIKNIIDDKNILGILNYSYDSEVFEKSDPELVFVFHPDKDSEIIEFSKELNNRHKLIIVTDSDSILK